MRRPTKTTVIFSTRRRHPSQPAHWRRAELPSARCFTRLILTGGTVYCARRTTIRMKKVSWAKNEIGLAWMTLFPRNQSLDNLGIYRARSMRGPPNAQRLGICHCPPPAALIAGTTEPLSSLWRRPVTKSPGPSAPLLARYRARRMGLYRLGSFHRVLPVTRHCSVQACTMAPEMCRLINAQVRSVIALQERACLSGTISAMSRRRVRFTATKIA